MKGLKIYACSGFAGVGARDADYTYWLDNTRTVNNTRAVNGLLAKINLLFSDLQYKELTDTDILDKLNLVDLYSVVLQGAKNWSGMTAQLERWGAVVNSMVDDRLFTFDSFDNDERDIHLGSLIEEAFMRMGSNEGYALSGEFGEWYNRDILNEDWNGLQNGGIDVFKGVVGIGGDEDAGKLLNDGGYYFFGTYLSDAQIKRGGVSIKTKVRYEHNLYSKAEELYGPIYTKDDFAKVIYCGCQNTLKNSPESVAETIFGNTKGIGSLSVTAILIIVQMVLGAVLTAIQIIAESVNRALEERESANTIGPGDINNGIIDPKALQYAYNKAHSGVLQSGSDILILGLVFGVIYKILTNKKGKAQ